MLMTVNFLSNRGGDNVELSLHSTEFPDDSQWRALHIMVGDAVSQATYHVVITPAGIAEIRMGGVTGWEIRGVRQGTATLTVERMFTAVRETFEITVVDRNQWNPPPDPVGEWFPSPQPSTLVQQVNGPRPGNPQLRWPIAVDRGIIGGFTPSHRGVDMRTNFQDVIYAPAAGNITVQRATLRNANNANNNAQAYRIQIRNVIINGRSYTIFMILYSNLGSPAYIGETRNPSRLGMPGIRNAPLLGGATIPIGNITAAWAPNTGMGGQIRTSPYPPPVRVEKGEVIGHVGGGHIHLEIWPGGTTPAINPMPFF